jgi:hypothetical protein
MSAHTCSFQPKPWSSPSGFAYTYINHSAEQPYNYIGSRKFRHGWEDFAPIAYGGLRTNTSEIPSMYPIPLLANFSTRVPAEPPAAGAPTGALWAEIWRAEALNVSLMPACVEPTVLKAQLGAWDEQLRRDFRLALEAASEGLQHGGSVGEPTPTMAYSDTL